MKEEVPSEFYMDLQGFHKTNYGWSYEGWLFSEEEGLKRDYCVKVTIVSKDKTLASQVPKIYPSRG